MQMRIYEFLFVVKYFSDECYACGHLRNDLKCVEWDVKPYPYPYPSSMWYLHELSSNCKVLSVVVVNLCPVLVLRRRRNEALQLAANHYRKHLLVRHRLL